MKRLAEYARSSDPSRLVSAACLVDAQENRIADRLADALDGLTAEAGVTIVGGKAQLDAAEDIIDKIIEI